MLTMIPDGTIALAKSGRYEAIVESPTLNEVRFGLPMKRAYPKESLMERNAMTAKSRTKHRSWSEDDPRFERVAEKRALILESAKAVFLSEGYAAASMERISAHAGVSKMTLYRHFKDKESLFIETINQQCGAIYKFSQHKPASSREEAVVELKRYGAAFIDVVIAPDILGLYQTLLGEMMRFPDLGRMFFDIVIARSIEAIERILSGIMSPSEVAWRAPAFMHLVMGDSYQRLSLGKLSHDECHRRCVAEIDKAARLIICELS